MKRFSLILALMSLLVVFAVPAMAQDACEDELGCVVIGADDPIVIATMLVRSGPNALLGDDSAGAVEVAVAQRDGMLLGREIEVVNEDSQCSNDGGLAAAQLIVADDSILGVIGTNCSGAAAGALPIISEAGYVLFSPSATNPALTNPDIAAGGSYLPGFFRTAHNDLFQGRLAAQFALSELGATTVATIHDGDPYTEGLQAAMADAFTELGGEVVFQGAVAKDESDMSSILTAIAAEAPDVIYFPVFEPASNRLTAQARQTAGLEDTILMTADGSFTVDFVANSGGDAALGMFQSGPFISGEAYDEFLAAWDEEIGGIPPSGFHAHAYDATNIILNAIEAIAVEDADGNLVVGRQALRDAISATTEYAGLTGTLTCQTEAPFVGDCATGEGLAIFEITQSEIDGNWPPAVVWTPADATEMDDMDMEATEESE